MYKAFPCLDSGMCISLSVLSPVSFSCLTVLGFCLQKGLISVILSAAK